MVYMLTEDYLLMFQRSTMYLVVLIFVLFMWPTLRYNWLVQIRLDQMRQTFSNYCLQGTFCMIIWPSKRKNKPTRWITQECFLSFIFILISFLGLHYFTIVHTPSKVTFFISLVFPSYLKFHNICDGRTGWTLK